jgi:hypothetical protein
MFDPFRVRGNDPYTQRSRPSSSRRRLRRPRPHSTLAITDNILRVGVNYKFDPSEIRANN